MVFEHCLRNYKPKDLHRPLNSNGIMKHIERLRKMVNIAVTMEWLAKGKNEIKVLYAFYPIFPVL